MLKGGGVTKSIGVVVTQELEVLAILKWGWTQFPASKRASEVAKGFTLP